MQPIQDVQQKPVSKTANAAAGSLRSFDKSIPGWPPEPQTLADAGPSWASRMLPHLILLLVPISSIGLGIAVLHYNNKAESDAGNVTKQAMSVTATLWPILFAAVLGPMLKAVVRYWAERGAKLGVLEMFHSSQSLVSTLRACFSLRVLSLWPLLLIFVWSLSPVGGQGALRAMDLKTNTTTVQYHLASYPKNDLSSYLREDLFGSISGQSSLVSRFHALVGAAFSAQDISLLQANGSSKDFSKAVQRAGGASEAARLTKRDLWRNVRIPLLHMLRDYEEETRDWVEVPPNMIPEYSSMIGVPVRGFPSTKAANTSFMIQTNYQTLKCGGPWLNITEWRNDKSNDDSLILESSKDTPMGVIGIPNIFLDVISDKLRDASPGVDKGISSLELAGYVEPQRPMMIAFYSMQKLTICTIATEYVDSMVECSRATQNEDLACSVRKMRRTAEHPFQGNLTALDIGRSYRVLGHVPYIIPSIHPMTPSMLEKWLYNPSTVFNNTPSEMYAHMYEDIPLEVFSNRLSMVINTNLLAMFNMSIIVGGDATQDVQ
ncbi:hypothetical protein OPT61_g6417 [Boeremia exigua]|uniref:Uncharacterized protein n=1 Tax=Boeremia exigua TaxID=749465 RepID=A0ACC2I6P3_9PLEO|nr:hypothetical protein OPT61_g6417 [Boeremia exigua]